MDDAGTHDVKAAVGFIDHGFDGLFGHAGVMLQLHRHDGGAGGHHAFEQVAVAHGTHKAAHRPHAGVAAAQGGHFGAEIEVLGLDGDAGCHGGLCGVGLDGLIACGGW